MIVLDHINIVTRRLAETVEFYCSAFGLYKGWSPPEPWKDGAWLYASNDKPILHVQAVNDETYGKFRAIAESRYVEKEIPVLGAFQGSGALDHISLASDDYFAVQKRLAELKIPFKVLEMPQFRVFQVYAEDPNGILVEINCPPPPGAIPDPQ